MTTLWRIRDACTCLALLALLPSCGPQWSISRILVNPEPIGGTATVLPVTLVAPAQRSVQIFVTFQRSNGFTDPIRFQASFSYFAPDFNKTVTSYSGFFGPVAASEGTATVLKVFCEQVDGGGGPSSAKLTILGTTNVATDVYLTLQAATLVTTKMSLEVVSQDIPTGEYVSANADQPLAISCAVAPPPPPPPPGNGPG